MTETAAGTIPGHTTGSWTIDPANSQVGFSVRHLGVTRVHGRFNAFGGTIHIGETVEDSSVTMRIDAASVDTGFPARDGYIRGEDVLSAGEHEHLVFRSTRVRRDAGVVMVDGELTIAGVTKPVVLTAELGGVGTDPMSGTKVLGAAASATFDRSAFGLSPNVPAAVIGERVWIDLDVQAALDES